MKKVLVRPTFLNGGRWEGDCDAAEETENQKDLAVHLDAVDVFAQKKQMTLMPMTRTFTFLYGEVPREVYRVPHWQAGTPVRRLEEMCA